MNKLITSCLFLIIVLFSNQVNAQIVTISSFTPTSGPIGTTVTITGTNFSTTAADNIVWFGAVKATVTNATATQLIVTVPIGATFQPISVTVSGLTASSKTPFIITYPSSCSIDVKSFATTVDFATGTGAYSTAIGDIDGDGKPDLAVVNNTSNTVSIFRNTSTSGLIDASSFATKVDLATGISPYFATISDIDGDGKPDLTIVNRGSNTVSVFRNTSVSGLIDESSFATKIDITVGTAPNYIAIGDIDGDGKPDLAVTNSMSNTVTVIRNTSTPGSITVGSFASMADYTTGVYPYSIAIGDIDGDNKPDLAITSWTNNFVSVLRNTSVSGSITAGSFEAKVDFTTGTNPYGVAIGDIDGDGKLDLAVTNANSNTVSVFRNTSTSGSFTASSFAAKVDFTTGSVAWGIALGDIDGDGKPDLAVTNTNSNTVSIFRNTSTSGSITASSFGAKVDFTAGTGIYGIAIGDIDGDSRPDLAIANSTSNNISVLRNTIEFLPAISSFTPTSGPIGTSVIITGNNFSTTPSNNIVWVGAVKATVTNATATQLTVIVPASATYQPITVTVNGFTAYSNKPFMVTFPSTSVIDATSFSSNIDFNTQSETGSVKIGDIDCDGKPDLTVATGSSHTISVFRNISTIGSIGTTSFSTKVDINTGIWPWSTLGDIDGDGKMDLVVKTNDNTVSVYRNTSTVGSITASSFADKVDFPIGLPIGRVAIGDIDGDGKPDLVVTNSYSTNKVSILRNISTPGSITASSFASKVDFTAGDTPIDIFIADIDGDSKPDIVVSNINGNSVSIFRNTSISGIIDIGSLAPKVDFTAIGSSFISVGDLDGDGKPDLITSSFYSNTISIYRNTSTSGIINTSSFAAKVDYVINHPDCIAIGDINGDGKLDLAVANYGLYVSVLKNTCTSGTIDANSFAPMVNFDSEGTPEDLCIGDIDGDGKSDLIISYYMDNKVSVFRNTIKSTYPVIFSVNGSNGDLAATVDASAIVSGDLVVEGKNVTFTATPANGYKVKEWKLNNVSVSGNNTNTYSLSNLTHASTVTVEFEIAYAVNFSVVGANGTLTAIVDAAPCITGTLVTQGKNVVFTATPAVGYRVKEWINNSSVVSGNKTNSYTISSISAATTVTVEFEIATDIENNKIEGTTVKTYPNPFNSFIKITNLTDIVRVEITGISGQIMGTYFPNDDETLTLKTENLPKGIYILTIEDKKGTKTIKKMIKN